MPLYDMYCKKCDNEEKDVLLPVGDIYEYSCHECGNWKMNKICSCKSFKLVYNNKTDICAWGNENYESSQYWKLIKEAREKGENVKSPNDKY